MGRVPSHSRNCAIIHLGNMFCLTHHFNNQNNKKCQNNKMKLKKIKKKNLKWYCFNRCLQNIWLFIKIIFTKFFLILSLFPIQIVLRVLLAKNCIDATLQSIFDLSEQKQNWQS